MDHATFRRHAHEIVDWMADYLEGIERRPVRSGVEPGSIASALPASAPQDGEPFADIMNDLDRIVMPGMTHWQHPRFFAYFPANATPPSILAEMITAALGAQCMLWQTSPAATEMETRLLDWLRQMIGLPDGFSGVIQDSASSAVLCAILTARERATGWQGNEMGLAAGPHLTAYASTETHSSVEKAVKIAGLGRNSLRAVALDDERRMDPEALDAGIRADLANGCKPAIAIATLGSTGIGAIDQLHPIGEVCQRHGVFLHVDAAWAGSALILPEYRWMLDGCETIDSLCFNPHKWLGVQFDCSAHFVRNPADLVRTLSILPPYLQGRETGNVIDYRDWGIPLGRRFRALKLWFVLRAYGIGGLQQMLRDHIAWTRELAGWIDEEPGFDLTSPARLALLSFRWLPQGIDEDAEIDRLNDLLVNAINDDGRIYLTPNRIDGRMVIRVSIGAHATRRSHVVEAWDVIREMAAKIGA